MNCHPHVMSENGCIVCGRRFADVLADSGLGQQDAEDAMVVDETADETKRMRPPGKLDGAS